MSPYIVVLMQFSIIAYAVIGGAFLAFSDFIMRSLSLTTGTGGIDAMQTINREVFRWVFMALFLGMAVLSLIIGAYGAVFVDGYPGTLMLLAGIIYLIGCFGFTAGFNVPLNNALAKMDLTADETRIYWQETYLPRWTFWNTIRTVACLLSAALLMSGLLGHIQAQINAG